MKCLAVLIGHANSFATDFAWTKGDLHSPCIGTRGIHEFHEISRKCLDGPENPSKLLLFTHEKWPTNF